MVVGRGSWVKVAGRGSRSRGSWVKVVGKEK